MYIDVAIYVSFRFQLRLILGWVNEIAPSSTLSSTAPTNAVEERRLIDTSLNHIPAPAKFLKVDEIFCGNGFVNISDHSSARHSQIRVDSKQGDDHTSEHVKYSWDSEFVVDDIAFTVPSTYHNTIASRFSVVVGENFVYGALKNRVLMWDRNTGTFENEAEIGCVIPGEIVGLCPSSTGAIVVYRRGDLCLI